MAYMVARTEKRKIGSLGGYQNHVDRKTENHSNKDIDDSKTHLNYDLIGHERSTSFHEEFMDYIKENRVGSRAVRKDAVVMQDWLISSSQEFFDTLNENETKKYFETAVEFFAENFGRENIRFATVHMDEKTPHMHMGIVPLKDGKLTAKTIFDRNCLRMIQNELPQAFQKAGFDIQRGESKSEKVHLHPEEYKATMRAAQEKSKEIIEQAEKTAKTSYEELQEQSYTLWEESWDYTAEKFPDFVMYGDMASVKGEIENLAIQSIFDDFSQVERDTPRSYYFTPRDVGVFLKEKFKQVHEYISLQAHKMASKVSELLKEVNDLECVRNDLNKDISQYNAILEERKQELEEIGDEKTVANAKMKAIQELSNSIDELRGHVKDEEPDIKIKQGVFSSEPAVTMPYSKYEKLKIANWNNGFEDSLKNFREEIGETLGKYRLYAYKAEQETERYKSKYDEVYDDYVDMVGQKNKKENVVTALREVAGFLPDGEWDKAINKREMQKAQEREMPSFDFDNDRGMSGPSL